MDRTKQLTLASKIRGNDIDPLMGTVFGSMTPEAVANCIIYERTKEAVQDGADFYTYNEGTPIAVEMKMTTHNHRLLARYEYPFIKRENAANPGDHWYSVDAAQEAAAMFLRDNPQYKLVNINE